MKYLALLLVLLTASPVMAGICNSYESKDDYEGILEIMNVSDGLNYPTDVFIDQSDNLYMPTDDGSAGLKLTPSGRITELFETRGLNFHGAYSIAVAPNGDIYVTAVDSHNVFLVEPDGGITEIVDSGLRYPTAIKADPNTGNIYVVGVVSSNVLMITPRGEVTTLIDESGDGTGADSCCSPEPEGGGDGVCSRETSCCYPDEAGGDLALHYRTGNGLCYPRGIAIDSQSNVYVAGGYSHNAFKITPSGEITQIIDQSADGAATLYDTKGIYVDASMHVYVTGQFSNNAFEIEPDGTITELIDISGDGVWNSARREWENPMLRPVAIVADSRGYVYVAGRNSHNVYRVTPSGDAAEILNCKGDGAAELFKPTALVLEADEDVIVSGYESHNLFHLVPEPGLTMLQVASLLGIATLARMRRR